MRSGDLPSSSPGRQLAAVAVLAVVAVGIIIAAYIRVSDQPDQVAQPDGAPQPVDQAKEDLKLLIETYVNIQTERQKLKPFAEKLREFMARNAEFAPGHRLLGQVSIDVGKPRDALKHLQISLDLDPRQPGIRCIAGIVAERLGDLDLAAKHYQEAIGLEPRNGEYRMHLANVHLGRGEIVEAKQGFLEALRLNSALHEAHGALSGIYASENKLAMALTQIRKAIELTPMIERSKHVIYVRKQAKLELRDGRPDDALRNLQSLGVKERFDPEVMEDIATCYANKSRPDLAAELYEEAMRVFPADWRFVAEAARWRMRTGGEEEFYRHIRTLSRLDPGLPVIAELERKMRAKVRAARLEEGR